MRLLRISEAATTSIASNVAFDLIDLMYPAAMLTETKGEGVRHGRMLLEPSTGSRIKKILFSSSGSSSVVIPVF